MSSGAKAEVFQASALDNATRVAFVAALSATTMLFASLASAYLVRRSFADWRPGAALWPFVLLACGGAASLGIELVARSSGHRRRLGYASLTLGSGLYFAGALTAIASVSRSPNGLGVPFNAFVALLLGVHCAHAFAGAAFSLWILRTSQERAGGQGLLLARLVTHFLTALLLAIVFLLFVLR